MVKSNDRSFAEQKRLEPGNGNDTLDFRHLFECAPALFLVLKPDYTIVAASDAYLKATMTKRKDIMDKGMFEIFPDNPGDDSANGVANLKASLDRVLSNKVIDIILIQKHDIRRPISEGGAFEEKYWTALSSPVFDPNGNVTYIIHRVDDITEKVRLENAKKEAEKVKFENEEKLKLILENIAEGVIVIDKHHKVILHNQNAEQIVGINDNGIINSPDEWANRYDLFYPDGKTTFPAQYLPLERALKGFYIDFVEIVVIDPETKRKRNVQFTGSPVRDKNDNIIAAVSTIKDVTAYKKMPRETKLSDEKNHNMVGFKITKNP